MSVKGKKYNETLGKAYRGRAVIDSEWPSPCRRGRVMAGGLSERHWVPDPGLDGFMSAAHSVSMTRRVPVRLTLQR